MSIKTRSIRPMTTLLFVWLALSLMLPYLASPQVAAASPDLVLENLQAYNIYNGKYLVDGQTVPILTIKFFFTVRNIGNGESSVVEVDITDGFDPSFRKTLYVPSLMPNETNDHQSNSYHINKEGKHTYTITLDPENQVLESNEENNTATFTVCLVNCNSSSPTATPTPSSTVPPATPTPTSFPTPSPTATPPGTPTVRHLEPGWQLISLSFLPGEMPIQDALQSIEGSYTVAYIYDPSRAEGQNWRVHTPGIGGTLTSVNPTMGLWILMTQEADLMLNGTGTLASHADTDVPIATLSLVPGWNLVGFPVHTALPVGEALGAIEGKFERLHEYGPDAWKTYVPGLGTTNTLTTIEPGQGYWIFMTESTVFILNP
ncbi:MAG: hypothetical protein HC893_00910 [Chloroflexaceae bacterium]|nr:hypothetical protein [Chloroflexaceae bacterium]